MKSIVCSLVICSMLLVAGCGKNVKFRPCVPPQVAAKAGSIVYKTDFSCQCELGPWVMEGPGSAQATDGWLNLESPKMENNLVYWLNKKLPASFIAEYDFQVLSKDGLAIVFIAAADKQGQSIFSADLPKRSGAFDQYTKGAINNYLLQYYTQNPTHLNDTDNELRKDAGFSLLAHSPTAIPRGSEKIYHITVIKDGGRIMMCVDDQTIIDAVDDGTQLGPAYGAGWMGLRQMKWTKARYRNLVIRELKN